MDKLPSVFPENGDDRRRDGSWKLSRTSREEAATLIQGLLSGYPTQFAAVDNKRGYIANLCSILCLYDVIDARAGVTACANSKEFLPTRYDLRQACERAATERTRSAHLRALPRGEPRQNLPRPVDPPVDPATGKHPPGTILSNYDAAVRLYGRPIGAFEPGGYLGPISADAEAQPHSETAETARAKFFLTPQQWADLPDTPPAGSRHRNGGQ